MEAPQDVPQDVEPASPAPVIPSAPSQSYVLAADSIHRCSSASVDGIPPSGLPRRKLSAFIRPNKQALAQTADPQAQSLFFSRLPAEIRIMIYVEMWRTAGSLRHHIVGCPRVKPPWQAIHAVCLTGGSTKDIRDARFRESRGRKRENCWDRLRSGWVLHWLCEETAARQRRSWSPFLPVLLTSRRM